MSLFKFETKPNVAKTEYEFSSCVINTISKLYQHMSCVYRKMNFDEWVEGLELNKGLKFRNDM